MTTAPKHRRASGKLVRKTSETPRGRGRAAPPTVRRTRTTPFDVTRFLRTREDRAAYLDACLVDMPDDAAGIARALGDIARTVGMDKVAKRSGLSREHLAKTLCTEGKPSLDTILRVTRAVGIQLHASTT